MNKMTVSPWLMVSPDGPLTYARNGQLIHLRQGGLDGACGPYCVVMALITLGVMCSHEARNMYQWHGNSRERRFRTAIRNLGALVSEGTDNRDMLSLIECFSGVGVGASTCRAARRRSSSRFRMRLTPNACRSSACAGPAERAIG